MHPRSVVGYEPDDWVPRCVGGSRLPILNHGLVTHGYYLRATDPRDQVTEVVRRFHLVRVRHEALCYPVGCNDPPVACRSRSLKLGAA